MIPVLSLLMVFMRQMILKLFLHILHGLNAVRYLLKVFKVSKNGSNIFWLELTAVR